MRRSVVLSAVALVAVLGLGACSSGGSSDKTKDQGGGGPAPVRLAGKVHNKGSTDVSANGAAANTSIEADDFYFNPTFVKAAVGATVTVALKNNGSAQHTFTIDGTSVDQVLDPDQKATVTVKVPASGALQFHCRFHESQGMQGAFYSATGDTVTSSGTGGSTGSPTPAPAPPAKSNTGGGYHY